MTNLKYDVYNSVRDSSTRGIPAGTEKLQWVANSAVLIYTETEAVLVDTAMTRDATEKIIDWIRDHHVTLKYIYITHAHSDHFFGAGMIEKAFPSARIIATQATADGIPSVMNPAMLSTVWEGLFPGQLPDSISGADEVVSDFFTLGDHKINILEDGFTDTHDSTSLWIPDAQLIVAGDATYNGVHPFLADTTLDARKNWINVNKQMKTLNPQHVVAGHKNPDNDDDPIILDETINYIEDFNRLSTESTTVTELYNKMLAIYPARLNPGSLWSAANAVIR